MYKGSFNIKENKTKNSTRHRLRKLNRRVTTSLYSNMYILLVVSILILYGVVQQFTAAGNFDGPNIAINKAAFQSPGTYCLTDPHWNICYNASLATDGITGDGDHYRNHCSQTNVQHSTAASLVVHLKKSYFITGIRIYNRKPVGNTEVGQRLKDFEIEVIHETSWMVIHKDKRSVVPYETDIALHNPLLVKGIKVKIPHRQNGPTILSLCEVEIYAAWCPDVDSPTFGRTAIEGDTGERIKDKITAGTVVRVSCDNGRKLLGPAFLECLINGSYAVIRHVADRCSNCPIWDKSKHRCKHVTCYIPVLSNGKYTITYPEKCIGTSSDQPVDCEIKPDCNEGYELSSESPRICSSTGQWTSTGATCSRTTCNVPASVQGGLYHYGNGSEIRKNTVYYNEMVVLHCRRGYVQTETATRICQANKTLSGTNIGCNIVTCGYIAKSVVTNGRYRLSSGEWFAPGHTAKYNESIYVECNAGFTFHTGSRNRTCQDSAAWSGEGAVCVAVTCPRLKSSERLQYTYSILTENTTFPYNTTVNITCQNGPLASISEERRCTEKGVWDGSPPECVSENPDSSNTLPLSGGMIGAVAGLAVLCSVLTVVVLLLVVWRKKIRKQDTRYADLLPVQINSETPDKNEYAEIQDIHVAASEATPTKEDTSKGKSFEISSGVHLDNDKAYYNFAEQTPKTAVFFEDLPDLFLRSKLVAERFKEEFERFPEGMQDKHSEALKSKNRDKNRYKNLYAYDSSRVVLETNQDYESDYINACYIHGFQKTNTYIASQGPTEEILVDFWRMVWDTRSSKIVMLTKLIEQGQSKCGQYWPDEESLQYGKVKVATKEVDIYSDFIIRRFLVQKDQSLPRTVSQYHFTAWPDKGVPKYASSLVHFRNKVRYDNPTDFPVIVHCSAGVGRTGTFIALDYLTDQAEALGYVDVVRCVESLRRQRVNLVQTLDQYVFVHHALAETLMLTSAAIPVSQFPKEYKRLLESDSKTKKRKLDKEFNMLTALSPVTEKDQYFSAKDVRNSSKNRYSNILPADEFMPKLTNADSGEEEYVNAIFLPSYKEKKAFIITQTPLETTKGDFWRLVWNHDIHTIVMMNNVTELKPTEIYWPNINESMQFGNLKIENSEEMTIESHHIITLTVSSFLSQRNVKFLQCGGWHANKILPDSPRVLFPLLQLVQSWQRQNGNHTVLVHCMNGAEKSGLYCVISAVLERMKIEQDVAISQAIEEMRNARVQIIPTVKQYKFCHDLVLAYIRMNETYSNFVL